MGTNIFDCRMWMPVLIHTVNIDDRCSSAQIWYVSTILEDCNVCDCPGACCFEAKPSVVRILDRM